MQLSFVFDRFTLSAGVIAERIQKYHKDDIGANEAANIFLKKYQKLKAGQRLEAFQLCHDFILSLGDKYYLEDKP